DGADKLNGGSGNDLLDGGAGNDELKGGSGDDQLFGGDGADKLNGGSGNDLLDGGAGNDELKGGSGNDQLFGGDGNDKLKGGAGDDHLDGGDVDDRLEGGAGNDVLLGGAGNDALYGDGGSGSGGGSGDALAFNDYLDGGAGNDLLVGGQGNDTLLGGADDDVLYGDFGPGSGSGGGSHASGSGSGESGPLTFNDYLDGGAGNDQVFGQQGDDLANYTMVENLGASDDYDGGTGWDTLRLTLTYGEQLALAGEIADYQAFLAANGNPYTDSGPTFQFTTVDLAATDFEALDVVLTNVGPTANGDAYGTDEDTALAVAPDGVLGNDTDPDHLDVLTVTAFDATSASGASVTMNPDGSFAYDPGSVFQYLAVGESATDTFSYTISDLAGATSTATVTITVAGVNDAPDAVDDAYGTDEDTPLVVAATGVLGNDTDVDASDTLSVSAFDATSASGAGVTMNPDGSFTYDPGSVFQYLAVGETATDTFGYTVSDGHGGFDTATVTLTIAGVNDAPDAVDDAYGTDEDTPLAVAATGVLGNDTDVDASDTLSVSAFDATSASGAGVTMNPDGSFAYDPGSVFQYLAVGESATDTFSYTVSDGHGGFDTATVTVTVAGVNDGPDAVDDTLVGTVAVGTFESGDYTGWTTIGNAWVATSFSTFYSGAIGPTEGSYEAVLRSGDAGDWQIEGFLGLAGGTLDAVNGNPDPTFGNATDGAAIQTSVYMNAGAVLSFDWYFATTDYTPFNDFAFVTINGAAYELADIPGVGSYGSSGWQTFSYTASASGWVTLGLGVSNTGDFGVDTYLVVDNVQAQSAGGAYTDEDTAITIAAGDLLANDSDPDASDVLSISAVSATSTLGAGVSLAGGDVVYDPTGALNYLAEGESATDTFTYTITDGHGGFDTATVTLTVAGVNDGPDAVDDTLGGTGGDGNIAVYGASDGTFGAGNVASDLAALGIFGSVTVLNGSESLATLQQYDSILAYQNGWSDSASIGNRLADYVDAGGGLVTATFIWQNEDAAYLGWSWGRLETDGYMPFENYQGNYFSVSLGSYDSGHPIMSGPLTITSIGGYYHDVVDLSSDAQLVASWNTGSPFVAVDGGSGVVGITLFPNDAYGTLSGDYMQLFGNALAFVSGGGAYTDEDTAVTIAAADLLANDSDPDASDVLSISAVSATSTLGAGVSLVGGDVVYDPTAALNYLAEGESATDTFTYTITDGHGGFDTATVTLTVAGVNDGPDAVADAYGTDEDTSLVVAASGVLGNDTDEDASDVLGVSAYDSTSASGAGVTMNADGSFTYDPGSVFQYLAVGESATDTFTYTITDGHGGFDTATVTLTVAGVNDAPVANDDSNATNEDTAVGGNVLGNDTDVDASDALSVSAYDTTSAYGAAVSVAANGGYTYNPAGALNWLAVGESVVDTFNYTVSDGHGGFDSATVSITVAGVNDPPTAPDIHVYTNITGEESTFGVPIPLFGDGRLVNGLGGSSGFGESAVSRNDDGNSGLIDVSSIFSGGLNFFGSTFTGLYINTNGNVTFGSPLSTFTPSGITGSSLSLIAPYWADVDTRGGDPGTPTPGGTSTGENLI
ncbi:MAG: tandem-95 repeat protein, partial [Proteobacteria bacterium]|nr:tandem-95 repeat protein [Pseudomonadota bacterium]